MTFFLVLDVLLAVVGVYLVKNIISRPSTAPYPPGPKGLPLVGNALDMPTSQEWKTYAQWGNRWGKVFLLVRILSLCLLSLSVACRWTCLHQRARSTLHYCQLFADGHRDA